MFFAAVLWFGVFGDHEGDAYAIQLKDFEKTVVLAAHEKTGTVASGQLMKALKPYVRVEHDFYWNSRGRKPQNAIEFVRNPFSMIMSAYYYHMKCSEALFNRLPLGNQGYIPHIRLLVGTNVSFCQRLRTLPRYAGLRLQYDFTMLYPYPELFSSVRAERPLLRVCLGNYIKNTTKELTKIGNALRLTGEQIKRVDISVRALKRNALKDNPTHFTKYDASYGNSIKYLRKYDIFRSKTMHRLETSLGCPIEIK